MSVSYIVSGTRCYVNLIQLQLVARHVSRAISLFGTIRAAEIITKHCNIFFFTRDLPFRLYVHKPDIRMWKTKILSYTLYYYIVVLFYTVKEVCKNVYEQHM